MRTGRAAIGYAIVCALLKLCLFVAPGRAQAVEATEWLSGSVDLNQNWRTHTGDDRSWAQVGFDDSQWERVELDDLGAAQAEWRWFRLHVKLAKERPHAHLLIVGGDGAYELYVNGRVADGAKLRSALGVKRPVETVIPLADRVDEFTLALRTHASATYTIWHLPLFLTVTVGTSDAIENERAAYEGQRLYAAIPSIAINLVIVLAGLAAFALYLSQRSRKEYLWLGLYLVLLGGANGLLYCSTAGIIALGWNNLLADPLIYVFTIMQIEFTFSFATRRVTGFWRIYEIVLLSGPAISYMVTLGWLHITSYVVIEALMILPAALLLPVALFMLYWRGNREAGWLIVPSLLPAATSALFDVGSASIFTGWGRLDFLAVPIPLGPASLQISDLGGFLFVLAIGVVMYFRFTRVSREQLRVAAELEAAREIQQRLVPANLPELPGYILSAVYLPAQEVGGDFYQVLEQSDGARLVVLGDVSGKGLKAAMTSTLALGAVRTLATEPLGPAAVLTRLNRQIIQASEGGFITCICLRLETNGAVTVANAGHLPLYRNGEELTAEADLPLGIAADHVYEESSFRVNHRDRLMLLSDGVVEARSRTGELFGFERTRAISGEPAEAIAAAALRHGQEDDITVLTVVRDSG